MVLATTIWKLTKLRFMYMYLHDYAEFIHHEVIIQELAVSPSHLMNT